MPTAIRPLPLREDWAPSYLAGGAGAVNIDKAFTLADAEGMCCYRGARVHGGWDWFAPAGTPIVAPFDARIVRAVESTDHYGGVFGGVLALARSDGTGCVMRHVDPALGVGASVAAGQLVGYVFDWYSGGDHLHLEMHRVIGSGYGYSFDNMIDPAAFDWLDTPEPAEPAPAPEFGVEALPTRLGGIGPDVYGGWLLRTTQEAAERKLDALYGGRATRVRLRGDGPPFGVVVWPEGRYGGIPRWIVPTAEERDAVLARVTKEMPGVASRKFRGRRNSMYDRLP